MFTHLREARDTFRAFRQQVGDGRYAQTGKNVRRPADPKPVTLSIELEDGQWRTWKLGVGDAVGLGGIRVDVQGDRAILVSRYDDNTAA